MNPSSPKKGTKKLNSPPLSKKSPIKKTSFTILPKSKFLFSQILYHGLNIFLSHSFALSSSYPSTTETYYTFHAIGSLGRFIIYLLLVYTQGFNNQRHLITMARD
ncbi:hypothetical protein QBC38DRAFT_478547 [Podospora fimiseda]|uniref:Uncharacterized protein n=1 Tax=Podospora fimiseda TaxID=252190 RepID=A0AAN7GYI9_9PEZI|nr:hypothetical protein QBC38DRAFT_478547 [Podospora fimiseda]